MIGICVLVGDLSVLRAAASGEILMTANGWFQIAFFLALILAVTKPLGVFMARVFKREHTFLDPVLRPLERLIYRVTRRRRRTRDALDGVCHRHAAVQRGVDAGAVPDAARCRQFCRSIRRSLPGVEPALAFNTAASFTTNTNWQNYAGETTMSYFTQMAGLAYHNFVSAAVGIALAIAFIRGIARREKETIGNFWVDLTRCTLWVLLPVSIVGALLLVSQGVAQNLQALRHGETGRAAACAAHQCGRKSGGGCQGKPVMDTVTTQTIAQGPVASQEIIKEWGTNGGGFFNANSAHPFENPTPLSNLIEMFSIFAISAGLTYTLGRMTGSPRHGWAVWAAMAILFLAGVTTAYWAEARGNPLLAGVDQHASATQAGGNMEGKEVRFGIANSALFATVTTDASCGAINGWHDSFTPLGGMVPLVNIMLSEVDLRRCGRGHVRHSDLRRAGCVYRRTDGGPHAGIPGQENRSLRREDGDAGDAGLSRWSS